MSIENSATRTLLSAVLRQGTAALSSSTIVQWTRNAVNAIVTVTRNSRVAGAARRVDRVSRASWLYRWLTAEPDPDVVVIDLRETRLVGPILALFERVLAPLVRHWDQTWVGGTATRLSDWVAARPVGAVSTVAVVAVLADLLALVGSGSPSHPAVGLRLVALSVALAGTRLRLSADELTETSAYAVVVALLSPPDPPEPDERDGPPPD